MRTVKWKIPLELENNTRLLLFSSCDTNYLKYAISLIRSVDIFSPESIFVLHIINPDFEVDERIDNLVSSLKSTQLAVSFEYINLSSLEEKQQIAYYASARFPQLAELLSQHQCPIFSLDADSLIVNQIDLDFSNKIDAEIILVRRDSNDVQEHLAIATGSIWLKPSENVRHFMRQVASKIDDGVKNCTIQWFIDQVMFYRQMQVMHDDVKVYNLKRKYADWDFHENSIVWAGKGERKDNDMRFFFLQSLLSDDIHSKELALGLKSYLFNTDSNLKYSEWMYDRLNSTFDVVSISNDADEDDSEKSILKIKNKEQRIDLFLPRLDLPWKESDDPQRQPPLLADDVLELRLYWKKFTIRLANAIERAGVPVTIIELPAWKINRQTIEASEATLALIPHRCYLDFDEGPTPVMFYMQEYFRSVFVLDKRGWSAASSIYPVDIEALSASDTQSFDVYRQRLERGELGSKFAQAARRDGAQLIASGDLPITRNWLGLRKKRPYIFFPLQIPHDQSIRYFSDTDEMTIIGALVIWAKANNIAVVMKPHPANRKSMMPFERLVDGHDVFWSEAHVYDLISHATGVYTINSGVGFETLFHCKPIVTFGRAEYDCVTFRASISSFDQAWDYCNVANAKKLEKQYSQFINWFLSDYAVDLSQPQLAIARLDELAETIVLRSKKENLDSGK